MKLIRNLDTCKDDCDRCPLDDFIVTTFGDEIVAEISERNPNFDEFEEKYLSIVSGCEKGALSVE